MWAKLDHSDMLKGILFGFDVDIIPPLITVQTQCVVLYMLPLEFLVEIRSCNRFKSTRDSHTSCQSCLVGIVSKTREDRAEDLDGKRF
jgi:hypothetical protein